MNATAEARAQQLVQQYLAQVEAALSDLPAARRHDVLEQVREHLDEVLPADARGNEMQVRTALDRLGSPADIAAQTRASFPDEVHHGSGMAQQPTSSALHDVSALVLLLVGGFIFLIGWVVGVVLLWSSRTWTVRDKLIGTLLLPLGLALPVMLGGFAWTTADSGPVVVQAEPAPVEASAVPQPDPQATRPDKAEVLREEGADSPQAMPESTDGPEVTRALGGLLLLGLTIIIPIASIAYLGWRRSRVQRQLPPR